MAPTQSCGPGKMSVAGSLLALTRSPRLAFARFFSKKRAVNVRKTNPRVPIPEAVSIAQSLYQIFKDHGSLTVSNTWNIAKESNISGLNSKTHMKIMLKWMRGRKMVKLFCNHVGSGKKFVHGILPEESEGGKARAIR